MENIGINLKILIDNFKDLKIIVTGSSAFELANKVKEPLTGRTITYKLFPVSFLELGKKYSDFELEDTLEERLKLNSYKKAYASSYFWRIYTGAELDYVEEKEMLLYGYEFKYSKTKASVPKSWIETYKADYKLISKENFLDFIK